jgi:NUMOD4 motif/HNH endonuclease
MKLLPYEIWRPIPDYEGYYEISTTGKVRGLERTVIHPKGKRKVKTKILVTKINNWGYEEVKLSRAGKTSTKHIHSLLAKTYIPNLFNKPEVNHINGNKADNRLQNIEWVTRGENMKHAYKTGLVKKTLIKDLCSGTLFRTLDEAAKFYKISKRACKYRAKGKTKKFHCLRYVKDISEFENSLSKSV